MKNRLMLLLPLALLAALPVRAQDWAKARLDGKSPRHQEWVKVMNGKREVESYITYPEVKDKATAVVVIHEIFGLSDWARSVTDELAEAGYIAISPDLLSGVGPNGGGTSSLAAADIGKAIQALPGDQVTADLQAVVDYAAKLPACNGKVVVAGFCWGGGKTLLFANAGQGIKAAFSFYGPQSDKAEDFAKINCPVYGFYAGNDARVDATIPRTTDFMKAAGKTYEPVIYDGAGHGFMRAGEDPTNKIEANKKGRDEAWQRWMALMKKI
jgi:carboxymethylenebutenolidase